MAKKKKKYILSPAAKLSMIILLIPVCITVYVMSFFAWQELQNLPFVKKIEQMNALQEIQSQFDIAIPAKYIPIYIAAEEKYHVPWTLLAAHHRIETRFSTMKTLISPVGAEGHMQFMPCTFVGWKHPTCKGLGEGAISKADKTSPAVIRKYGGYGVDANGDGVADPFNVEDAVFSAANYLSKNGASQGKLKKAIYSYNHSDEYVQDVLFYYHLYEDRKLELKEAAFAEMKSDEQK